MYKKLILIHFLNKTESFSLLDVQILNHNRELNIIYLERIIVDLPT
jgi:hypothetical protein